MSEYKYFTNPYNGLIQRIKREEYNTARKSLAQGVDVSVNSNFLYTARGIWSSDSEGCYGCWISRVIQYFKPIDPLVVKVFIDDGGYNQEYFEKRKF